VPKGLDPSILNENNFVDVREVLLPIGHKNSRLEAAVIHQAVLKDIKANMTVYSCERIIKK
jgi:hypothetical protein